MEDDLPGQIATNINKTFMSILIFFIDQYKQNFNVQQVTTWKKKMTLDEAQLDI